MSQRQDFNASLKVQVTFLAEIPATSAELNESFEMYSKAKGIFESGIYDTESLKAAGFEKLPVKAFEYLASAEDGLEFTKRAVQFSLSKILPEEIEKELGFNSVTNFSIKFR